MVKHEIDEIFDYLVNSYGKGFEINDSIYQYWSKELSQYEKLDIMERLKTLMSEERYSMKAPLLEAIVKGITKTSDKINFNELVYYCQFCHRGYNNYEQMVEHEDRCRSIRYIERQYKRFNFGTVNKKELYNLPQEEFDTRYKKLLKLVLERTTNEREKQIIKNIFNPPIEQKAKAFLNN